jgi:hypothetical protein
MVEARKEALVWFLWLGSCANGQGEEWVGVGADVTLLQQWHGRHVVGSTASVGGAPAPRASALPAGPTSVIPRSEK